MPLPLSLALPDAPHKERQSVFTFYSVVWYNQQYSWMGGYCAQNGLHSTHIYCICLCVYVDLAEYT